MISDTEFPRVVAAAGQGEAWALAALYRSYQPLLLRYLRAQDGDAGDDLASEAWIGVARGLAHFQGDQSAFRSWLFTIARRRLIEFRRRNTRRRTDAVASDRLDDVDLRNRLDPEVDVLDRLTAQSAVDEMVAGLPRDQAEAVLLRVVGGLPVAEVARLMERSPGHVRVLCHRALRKLAERYGPEVRTA